MVLKSSAMLALSLLLMASVSLAQDQSADARFIQTAPGNCEINSALLDSMRNKALEAAVGSSVVIVIARLGNGETSRIHNRRRLLAVKDYFGKYGLPSQKIVTAEGERVSGYGRIELYLMGQLRAAILANPNKAICVECCDPDSADIRTDRRSQKRRR